VTAAPGRARERYRRAALIAPAVLVVLAVWPLLLGHGHAAVVATDLVELVLAGGAAVMAWRRAGRERPWGWRLVALGCASWCAGQLIWSWYEIVLERAAPAVTLGTPGYLGSLVFFALGFAVLGAGGRALPSRARLAAEVTMVTAALVFVTGETVLWDAWLGTSATRLDHLVLVAYPLLDVAVVATALVAVLRRQSASLEIAAVGVIGLGVADAIFSYQHLGPPSFTTGNAADLAWMAGFTLLALAALRPDDPEEPDARDRTDAALRPLLGYLPVAAALGVVVWRAATRDALRPASIVVGCVIGLAILADQLGTYLENAVLTTALRRKLAELARSEERFRGVVDELAEGVLVVGPDGTIHSASGRIEVLSGFPVSSAPGRCLWDFVHPDDAGRAR
jgi:PAS domain-containing protein